MKRATALLPRNIAFVAAALAVPGACDAPDPELDIDEDVVILDAVALDEAEELGIDPEELAEMIEGIIEDAPDEDELQPIEDLRAPDGPQAADPFDGPMFGGPGGTYYERECPDGYVGIGTIQAENSNGSLIRQLALVCGPRIWVNLGLTVPPLFQWVISSSHRSPTWPYWFYAAAEGSRATFDALYAAPNYSVAMCDAGYHVNGITARAGALVDRITSVTCGWEGPGSTSSPVYSIQVGAGGWGGSHASSFCQRYDPDLGVVVDQVTNGLRFRSGDLLDAAGLLCDD